ncbi:MAG: restriction endonuclease [Armatimonadota bacterium]
MRQVVSGIVSAGLFLGAASAFAWWGGTLGYLFAGTVLLVWVFRLYPAYARIRRLRAIRLAQVDTMSGDEFEDYVALLLQHRGYVVERTGGSGDLGVDLVASRRGERCAVQVKRRSQPVSRRAVSDAVAGADHYECDTALVVTNQTFTRGALELAASTDCGLVGRDELSEWIAAYAGGRRK